MYRYLYINYKYKTRFPSVNVVNYKIIEVDEIEQRQETALTQDCFFCCFFSKTATI